MPASLFHVWRSMESLKLYRISDKYIRFLKTRDRRVQDNKNRHRPYVGVVLLVGNFRYFVPMESPKPNHANIKSGWHIMRIDEGKLGILGFNNMIPVHESALISFDVDKEPNEQYADLLRRQISFINRRKADVLNHAAQTYIKATSGKNKFLSSICCDFKKLERACKKYDPNYVAEKRTIKS